jgi:ABC-2 type transport system ATP-binding protein
MIQVQDLTKRYGRVEALRGVGFSVPEGEVVGFLGPNGAGKTTTLKILTGFLSPDSGSVRVGGLDPARDPLAVRRKIGYLPENTPLYPEMTVTEYLGFVARVKGARNRAGRTKKILASCGLEKMTGRRIKTLSKGYRQRVGLGQALMGDPRILILDEPTIGLDPTQIVEMRSLIKNLGESRTVILSSHILPEVAQTCNRVVIISEGRVVAQDLTRRLTAVGGVGAKLALTAAGSRRAIEEVLEDLEGLDSWRVEKGGDADKGRQGEGKFAYVLTAEPGRDLRPEAARALVSAGLDLLELKSLEVSLEDVFVRLVTEEADRG